MNFTFVAAFLFIIHPNVFCEEFNLLEGKVKFQKSALEYLQLPKGSQLNDALKFKGKFTKIKQKALVSPPGDVWFRVTVQNPESKLLLLEYPFPIADVVDFYQLSVDGSVLRSSAQGDHRKFENRPLQHHHFVFKVDETVAESQILVRIHSNSPIVSSFFIYEVDAFYDKLRLEYAIFGICFGGMFIMALFNFFIYLKVKEKYFFNYSLYYFFGMLTNLALLGIAAEINISESLANWHMNKGPVWFGQLTIFTAVRFAVSFLELEGKSKKMAKALNYFGYAVLLVIPLVVMSSYHPLVVSLCYLSLVLSSGFLLVAGVLECIKGAKLAYYFTAAWMTLIVGNIVFTGYSIGLIPLNIWTQNFLIIGMAIEGIVLSIALGVRLNDEKSRVFREMKQKFHYHKQLDKVFYPHQLAQIEKGAQLEETMPVAEADVCVISFDIQNSSSIGHLNNHEFFETVMKRCHRLMMSYYNPETLEANAYMIKEMGDGFLCSLGFPFRCRSSIYDNALLLAEQFCLIFHQVAQMHLPEQQVFCSVGIACGKVQGYFPASGLKQYDIYGDAIIKATRYEGMRRILMKQGFIQGGSLIILEEEIYRKLNHRFLAELTRFDLGEFKIRDVEEAANLYYKHFDQDQSWIGFDRSLLDLAS